MRSRVLVISSVGCGPPYHGNRARVRALLRQLRQLGYKVDFAGVMMSPAEVSSTLPFIDRWRYEFAPRGQDSSRHRKLGAIADRVARSLRLQWGRHSQRDERGVGIDKWFRQHWLDEARQLQKHESYDRVLVSYVFHSAFLLAFGGDCIKLLDAHDAFAGRKERLAAVGVEDFWFTCSESEECQGLMRADVTLAIQEHEAEYFRRILDDRTRVVTVGHFVDVHQQAFESGANPVIGYLASENALNVQGLDWFVASVWPLVLEQVPNAELHVGGRICERATPARNISLMGHIEDLDAFYRSCMFAINPMLAGTGLKIKTVEAMAYGRAVVASPAAVDGLRGYLGSGLYEGSDAKEFADLIVALLVTRGLACEQGRLACRAVKEMNAQSREMLRVALMGA